MSPLLAKAREIVRPSSREIPKYVEERLQRGRKEMRRLSRKRRLCKLFLKGEQYHYLDNEGQMQLLPTGAGVQAGRPRHRIRNTYNVIRPMVDAKVSSSTTRVPGYEVNPASTDPEDAEAAALAQKVVQQGFRGWYLRQARVKAATTAIGGGGSAYALPYFDPMIGPFRQMPGLDGEPGELVGEGEIKVLVLNGNEAFSEPGTDWVHSRWYAIEHARPISEVREMPGFNGAKLTPDASTADLPTDRPRDDMVLVTVYFERPSPRHPNGRMLTMCGENQILPEESYPLMLQGQAIDEPCIHRLVYRLDPDNDDDLGLTWELIDFQRTISDCFNKMLELKNRGLHLQMLAPEGSLIRPRTDEPGATNYYRPVGGYKPEWEQPPNPAILQQLQGILHEALELMRYAAADTDVAPQPNVAGTAVQAVIQQAANRWSQFLEDFAEWDSSVARHCLLLAQEKYTEERVLKVRGRYGWEPYASFRGADIHGQVDVQVNPATIETHSRQARLQQLSWIVANFPGYVRPEVAIEIAMHGASPESILESFELDKARANSIIQKIRDGTIMDMPTRTETKKDPLTGQVALLDVPGWMPRPFDEVAVQAWVFSGWMKTDDAAKLPPELYEVAMLIYDGYQQLAAEQQAQELAAQTMQAQELGADNAAKPQIPKPMPSTPNPAGEPSAP